MEVASPTPFRPSFAMSGTVVTVGVALQFFFFFFSAKILKVGAREGGWPG